MSYREYWEDSPWFTRAYLKKDDYDTDARNVELWLQGLYNSNAFETALSNLHFDGKPHKRNTYIDKPLELRPRTVVDEEEERQKATEIVVGQLEALFTSFNKHKNEVEADAGNN